MKQVIVMRKDLNMRKGKMVAQGAHASILFMLKNVIGFKLSKHEAKNIEDWITHGMTKICVGVDSEKELLEIIENAKKAKLRVHQVTDAGRTEFNGVPTLTCCAIGPDNDIEVDKITSHLSLL